MSLKLGPHSVNPPIGNEDCGIVRTIAKKNCGILLFAGSIAANSTNNFPWIDTSTDGTTAVELSVYGPQVLGLITILQTDDPSEVVLTSATSTFQLPVVTQMQASSLAAYSYNIQAVITARYWRLQVQNGATAQVVTIRYTAGNNGVVITGTLPLYNSVIDAFTSTLVGVAPLSGITATDGIVAVSQACNLGGTNNTVGAASVANGFVTSASGTAYVMARTPAIFKGGQGGIAAGAFSIWQPQLTKKVRAMKYMIEVAEDATITSGPLPINIGFRFGLAQSLAATFANTRSQMFDYTHRVVLPAAVLATSFDGYVSPWIDLGNGVVSSVAGQSLFCGIQVPATTGAVTPTWTLATTGQWEAGCCAFTTLNGKGAFRLVNAYNLTAGVASAASAAVGNGWETSSLSLRAPRTLPPALRR